MALIWVWNVLVFVFFVTSIYYSIMLLLNVAFLLFPNIEYDSDIYLQDESNIEGLPNNIKSKTTTKMRWAKRSQDNNSFANGIMWADLGND